MLTEKQRQVIDLKDRQGLSFAKIAKTTGRDKSAVFKSYKAGKKELVAKAARAIWRKSSGGRYCRSAHRQAKRHHHRRHAPGYRGHRWACSCGLSWDE